MAILTNPEEKATLKQKKDISSVRRLQNHQLFTTSSTSATKNNDWSLIDSNVTTLREKDICIGKLLGSGGFSNVFDAYHRENGTGQRFAIKILKPSIRCNKQKLIRKAPELVNEAVILANLDHDHVITLYGIKEGNISTFKKNGKFFLAMDPLQKETLEDKLENWRQKNKGVSLRHRFFVKNINREVEVMKRLENIALGITSGMEYIHSKQLLHRDLKPANIGFDKVTGNIKIFDFGLARFIPSSGSNNNKENGNNGPTQTTDFMMTTRLGTPIYMAPEVARGGDSAYSFPLDVYSFAIILWQLVTDQIPFERISSKSILFSKVAGAENLRPSLKKISNKSLRDLIETCWSANPDNRPSFAMIRQQLKVIIASSNIAENNKRNLRRKIHPFARNDV